MRSLSVVIPAYNEEENLGLSLDNVLRAVDGLVDDLEIIVIDDGSNDATRAIAEQRAGADPRIRAISNEVNRGYGFSYRRGVSLATKYHVGVFTADNDMSWESFRDLVLHIGEADIISSYTGNSGDRELLRQVLSGIFNGLINVLFGLRVRYFNGPFIARREDLQALTLRSTGLTALAECKVKMLKKGCSIREIPFIYVHRTGGRSSALRFKSIKAAIAAVGLLYHDVHWEK